MNSFRFCFALCSLLCTLTSAWAQHTVSGRVRSLSDSTAVVNVLVTLQPGNRKVLTDASGYFLFDKLKDGKYSLTAQGVGFTTWRQEVVVAGEDVNLSLYLYHEEVDAEEVTIYSATNNTYLKSTENMGIYEGKKSEVITTDSLVANISSNNARQIYARVPGLNIWENDGAGIQLGIGGRGLDPNRTSNFNVRQNGYDISADALGYPESYYTPPTEAVERIQIVRGAASLQYGTQFGGLLNFVMRKPNPSKRAEVVARQTLGSFGFYNTFTSLSGTIGKLSYYNYFQYKRGDGWRPNAGFETFNYYANVNYKFTERTSVGIDLTLMDYLAQQPGGLSDDMFRANARQSNRERNWFKVKWNMLALHFNHKFNALNEINLRVFGLSAYRYSLGFRPARVATIDDNSERDLIKGNFLNWGAEFRYLKRYHVLDKSMVLLVGTRYYKGFNHSIQGLGSKGKDADFSFVNEEQTSYDYTFPNQNIAVFAENIFYLNDWLSVTPGLRYEWIHTVAKGYYGTVNRDLAGNIISIQRTDEERSSNRQFLLGGIGLSVRPFSHMNVYANISQNYRSITFNDMRISNPSFVIDPNMQDEQGYSADVGVRSEQTTKFIYDVSLFYMNYSNRIGEVQTYDASDRVIRKRGNIGQAALFGLETYVESDVLVLLLPERKNWGFTLFSNVALIKSEYVKSEIPGVQGNEVEFVPLLNAKFGSRLQYKRFKASFQLGYVSDQYSDATNAEKGGVTAVVGLIPAYQVMDLSLSYEVKFLRFEASVNNLGNQMYFTRRATAYPGPGILPSDGRSYFLTVQVKW